MFNFYLNGQMTFMNKYSHQFSYLLMKLGLYGMIRLTVWEIKIILNIGFRLSEM